MRRSFHPAKMAIGYVAENEPKKKIEKWNDKIEKNWKKNCNNYIQR